MTEKEFIEWLLYKLANIVTDGDEIWPDEFETIKRECNNHNLDFTKYFGAEE